MDNFALGPVVSSNLYTCLPKASLSVEELEAGIRNEYAKNYLWTGHINESLYEVRFQASLFQALLF